MMKVYELPLHGTNSSRIILELCEADESNFVFNKPCPRTWPSTMQKKKKNMQILYKFQALL